MNVEFDFKTGTPTESGEYVTAMWWKDNPKPSSIMICYYNAQTERWNDYFGDGKNEITDVDMWAEIPAWRKEQDNG